MGAAALPIAVGASLLQARAETGAAGVQQAQLEAQASQEETGAKQREGDRKFRLAQALASQNAQAGASGIAAFEGSPLTILEQDIQSEERATQRDVFQTQLKAATLRQQGRAGVKFAKQRAAIGLLTAGVQGAALGGRSAAAAPAGG